MTPQIEKVHPEGVISVLYLFDIELVVFRKGPVDEKNNIVAIYSAKMYFRTYHLFRNSIQIICCTYLFPVQQVR